MEVVLSFEVGIVDGRVRKMWNSFDVSVVELGKFKEGVLMRKMWEVLLDGEVMIVFVILKSYFLDLFI